MNNSIIESVLSQKCLGVDLDNRLIFTLRICAKRYVRELVTEEELNPLFLCVP